jgi:MFS family permease
MSFFKQKWVATLLAAVSAFCVYTCMYAFRKPFTAADFKGYSFLHIDYKIWLVIAQTVGYTLSKFYGIRFIAEMKNEKRTLMIIQLIAVSWISLLLFAIVPAPYNIVFLFINGFPLGMIYGLVFSYLEGRQTTEFLGAVLATSFIFASGFTQTAGKYILLNWGIDQWWMPCITGLLFFVPLLFFTWLLSKTPAPTEKDILLRTERSPMTRKARKDFLRSFFPGLLLLIIAYVMLTVIRDYRSNFAADIWNELGQGGDASVFTRSEIPASLVVLALMSLLIVIKRNIDALLINHLLIVAGFLISIGSTILFTSGVISAFWWMTLTGVGLYMGYVPFNCMLFERLIATFRYAGNAGFIIYVADSFGYLGSDVVLLIKNFGAPDNSWTVFFVRMILVVSFIGIILVGLSAAYFQKRYREYFPVIPSKLTYG